MFKAWHKVEVARRLGQYKDIDERMNDLMAEKNIKIEYFKPLNRYYPKGIMGS